MLILKKLSDGRKEYIEKYKCLENLVKFTFLLKVMNLIGVFNLFFGVCNLFYYNSSTSRLNFWIFLILLIIIRCILLIAKVYKEVKEKDKSFIIFRRYLLITNILSYIYSGTIIGIMIIIIEFNLVCEGFKGIGL